VLLTRHGLHQTEQRSGGAYAFCIRAGGRDVAKGRVSDEEIALIKAMLASGNFPKDRIQAFFTRPERVLNFGRITDIERGRRGAEIEPASPHELEHFLETWTPGEGALPKAESNPFSKASIESVLRIDVERSRIRPSETDRVEFKLAWNGGQADEYARSMAAFANNRGGYLVFGVKDGSGEIVGLSSDKFAGYDPARLSARIHDVVQPELDWDKCVIEICGKNVGVIYVAECHLKPIIGIKDTGAIEDGAVYFRYPGETRRIRHFDLMNLIMEREKRLSAAISDQVARIAEVGPYDAAILNTSAGELEVSGRSLVLAKPLADQINRLARGEFYGEDEAFELSGSVGVKGDARGPTVIKGRVSDYDVLRDFTDRVRVANPFDYIRHFLDTQTAWLPLFWFALLYGRPIPQLIAELDKLPKLKPKSWTKLRERLEGKRGQKRSYTYPSKEMLNSLKKGEPLLVKTDENAIDAMRTLFALETSSDNEAAVFQTLACALAVFDANRNVKLFAEIRYAASFVDQQLYRQACAELGKD
jgi:Putative DNA-binding domain